MNLSTLSTLSYESILALATSLGLVRGEPRGPSTPQEQWALAALVALTAECDGAVSDDAVGFNKADTQIGRYLGHYVAAGGLLDDCEWRAAVAVCGKYHGQIGERPEATGEDVRLDGLFRRGHNESDDARDALDSLRGRARAVTEASKRAESPDVVIERDGERLLVSTPYAEAASNDWRRIPSRRWDSARKVNAVAVADSRALNALLEKHYRGKIARGPKGVFVVGGIA